MTELAFIYFVIAAFLLGLGLPLGGVSGMPVAMVIVVAISWPAIALYALANLITGFAAGFCWALWRLVMGSRP
jgi:hypothetical protein